jgi:hypothetical protein
MPSKPRVPSAVRRLFAALPSLVQPLALAARNLVLTALADAVEYGYGAGYKDMVATLILKREGRSCPRRFFARSGFLAARRRKGPSLY